MVLGVEGDEAIRTQAEEGVELGIALRERIALGLQFGSLFPHLALDHGGAAGGAKQQHLRQWRPSAAR